MTSTSVRSIVEPLDFQSEGFLRRYILAQVGARHWVFPATWVVEVFRVRQAQVLSLPFYNAPLLGVTHHDGKILPIISSHHLFKVDLPSQEVWTIIHLEMKESRVPSVGLVVDRAIGSCTRQDLPDDLFSASPVGLSPASSHLVLFGPDDLPQNLWQPLHWTLNMSHPIELN